ncbi:hypothetical protein FA13DRAFT_1727118 [Coprinellus micaceus]|uniref:DUF6533 domain-containing protein n=1 Tax=Coprinellus micaceus TaxID=71717 RepID=A0A4Y7TRF0_COPMI|nr:hypothetical protein FA13DRAFT_1727118 [Coprinellus micaceus]
MDEEALATLAVSYERSRIRGYLYLASYTALIYHYLTTIDQEVAHIWPQPRWKLGKVLFLATRYSAMVTMAQDVVVNLPSHAVVSLAGCQAISLTVNLAIVVTHTSAEATLWLCLYALLEGKQKYFYILVATFLSFTIPMQVLQSFATLTQKAVVLDPIYRAFGYPCRFADPSYMNLYAIAAYLSFTRTLVASLLALATFIVRYQRQRNSLIRVIRREGGMYFLTTLVLKFFDGLNTTAKSPVKDKYNIVWSLSWVCINVFAERLLLLMKKIDHPGTQTIVSDLMFAGEKSQSTTSEDFDESGETMHDISGGLSRMGEVEEVKSRGAHSPETEISSV